MKAVSWLGFSIGVGLLVGGCGYPAFTSAAITSSFPADVPLEGHCLKVDRDGIPRAVAKAYAEGRRLIFVSEYTSTARAGFPSIICFERPVVPEPEPVPPPESNASEPPAASPSEGL